MDTRWLCVALAAIPIAFWAIAWISATVGMARAIQPRPHRARALAARLVRELGGRLEEGERGQWRAVITRGALAVAARVSSSGFGDVIAVEIEAPRAWVPAGASVSLPFRGRDGEAIAPANLSREGSERRWNLTPEGAPLEPRLLDWLFSPASLGVTEIRDRIVKAMYRRDDSNDDAHVEEIRRALDALGAIVD